MEEPGGGRAVFRLSISSLSGVSSVAVDGASGVGSIEMHSESFA